MVPSTAVGSVGFLAYARSLPILASGTYCKCHSYLITYLAATALIYPSSALIEEGKQYLEDPRTDCFELAGMPSIRYPAFRQSRSGLGKRYGTERYAVLSRTCSAY